MGKMQKYKIIFQMSQIWKFYVHIDFLTWFELKKKLHPTSYICEIISNYYPNHEKKTLSSGGKIEDASIKK